MKENVPEEFFVSSGNKKSETYREIIYDLDRLKLLKETIDELLERKEEILTNSKKDNVILNYNITRLANKRDFATNTELQDLAHQLQEQLKVKRELYDRKISILNNQITDFRRVYYALLNKDISVNCGNLINELRKITGENIYCNLYIDKVFMHSNLKKMLKSIKNKEFKLELTISDKNTPEYLKENNKVYYSKSFPVDFDKLQNNMTTIDNIIPEYGITEDGKKYTYLKINDVNFINLDFKFGDLVKETEFWKPTDLLKEAVLSYKKKERDEEKIKGKKK